MKKCKYCMSEIDENAIVCPVCKRRLDLKEQIAKIDKKIEIILFVILGAFIISYLLVYVILPLFNITIN